MPEGNDHTRREVARKPLQDRWLIRI